MIRSRWTRISEEDRYHASILKMIRSILMLTIKKHLKSLYKITSTEIARASLTVDEPGINKRDMIISGVDVKEMGVVNALKKIPTSEKELVSLIKLFQSYTFDDPVETIEEKSKAK